MESGTLFTPPGAAVAIIIGLITLYTAYIWYMGRNTVPAPAYIAGFENKEMGFTESVEKVEKAFKAAKRGNTGARVTGQNIDEVPEPVFEPSKEGFYGGAAHGTGSPDCLRSSSEGAALINMFVSKGESTVEEGPADLRELTQLVGKLCCFKKDLVSPSYIVDATRKQTFVTMHDIEPIAETTGRCFAKTISPRDLELAFDKWTSRGELLISRLCTAYRLSESDVINCQNLFHTVVRDVKDIARGSCLSGEPMIAGKPGPRDPHPFDAPANVEFGEYTGYY